MYGVAIVNGMGLRGTLEVAERFFGSDSETIKDCDTMALSGSKWQELSVVYVAFSRRASFWGVSIMSFSFFFKWSSSCS